MDQPEVIASLRNIVIDLAELAERLLPAPPDRVEDAALILDRLSEETAQAAAALRGRPARTDCGEPLPHAAHEHNGGEKWCEGR
jgi:hypothetical protein